MLGQAVLAVLANGEAAAFVGALVGEGSDDSVAVGLDAVPGDGEVGVYLGFGGEEVEGGAVMPQVVGGGGVEAGDVLFEPLDLPGACA